MDVAVPPSPGPGSGGPTTPPPPPQRSPSPGPESSGRPPHPGDTENPFCRRPSHPTGHHDLSRLYPPLPRGDFSPPHVTPSPSPAPPQDNYFVLRPGTVEAAVRDVVETMRREGDHDEDLAQIENIWLLTEVDHWNREAERLVLLTDRSLLVCQYDFVGLYCHRILRVPLNYIDRITAGPFSYPETCLSRRSGSGLRIQWDKLREPSRWERWNPWSQQIPFLTLTEHPAVTKGRSQSPLCQLSSFREKLTDSVLAAHRRDPVPGRANGPLLLEQPIRMEISVGLLSTLTNWTQLGFAKTRGTVSF